MNTSEVKVYVYGMGKLQIPSFLLGNNVCAHSVYQAGYSGKVWTYWPYLHIVLQVVRMSRDHMGAVDSNRNLNG